MQQEERDLTINQALDIGTQLAMTGQDESAITLFRSVLMHEPSNFEAIQRLGSSLFNLERFYEALYWFWRGRIIDKRHPLALTNYGLCISQLGHWQEAVPDLERAVYFAEKGKARGLSPEVLGIVYNNLGNTLERLKRYPEALIALDKGIGYTPNDTFPHYNRGIVLLRLNRHKEAIAALDFVLEQKPNDADARYNRSMARLLLGDFKGGFADYEARLVTREMNKKPNFGFPEEMKWNGEDIAGKSILVFCEQGIGDTVQCLRFLPQLAARGPAEILMTSHEATKALFLNEPLASIPGLKLIPAGKPYEGKADRWVALMSLPYCLGIEREEQIPPPLVPVIEPGRIAAWRDGMALPKDKLNIGVVWAGNWQHKNDEHRSIALKTFAKLFDAPGCNFVSLQQIRPGEIEAFDKLKSEGLNLKAFFTKDFRDTAAAILNLDLVISVDTAVAHLAGTLGVPTFILIPKFGTDWRWQLEREDSPWYPSARLLRQPKVGNWEPVIQQLKRELTDTAQQAREAA